jgi:hypothetical protein
MKLVLLPVLVIALVFVSACAKKARTFWPDGAAESLDRYYDQYLTGDTDKARQSLKDAAALMQSVDSRAQGRAHGLWLGYARLSVLEQAAGHEADAMAFFETAKNWYRMKLEASGESSQKIAAALEGFTPASCLELVNRFDAAQTEGRGPQYLRETKEKTKAQPDDPPNGSRPIRSK